MNSKESGKQIKKGCSEMKKDGPSMAMVEDHMGMIVIMDIVAQDMEREAEDIILTT